MTFCWVKDQKSIDFLFEEGMTRLKLYESRKIFLWRIVPQLNKNIYFLSATNIPINWWNYPVLRVNNQKWVFKICRNRRNFSLNRKLCSNTEQLEIPSRIYNKDCKIIDFRTEKRPHLKIWWCLQESGFFRWHGAIGRYEEHRDL